MQRRKSLPAIPLFLKLVPNARIVVSGNIGACVGWLVARSTSAFTTATMVDMHDYHNVCADGLGAAMVWWWVPIYRK